MLNWRTSLPRIVTHPLFPVLLVCFLSLGLRLYRINIPHEWYFDEVYHGFTAVEYAKGNKDAYDPWASAPIPDVAYEWVHPPLAKIIMSWSVSLFGPVSWAWRLPSVFFGTAVIGLTGILAWVWFRNGRLALLASTFLAVDGLTFVMSRLAMNDVFFLTFLLLCLIFYSLAWQKPNRFIVFILAAAVAFGAAISSKWTTIYLTPVLGIDLLYRWGNSRKFVWRPLLVTSLAFILLVPAMYLLSHAYYFAWGYTWADFVMLQKQIWWYHTGLDATHPYQSVPWQWLFDLRPVWFYSGTENGWSKNIYALGNPIFFWAGLVAVGLQLRQIIKNTLLRIPTPWPAILVLLTYVCLWLPWTFSPRIMFFYHYLPALPFLAIALAKGLVTFETGPDQTLSHLSRIRFTLILFSLMAGWFIIFYPQLSATPISLEWAQKIYYVLPSWR